MLEVRLLDKFDVRRDGKSITIASRPAQSLFAYLVLNAGTSHRREKLAGLLWPDSPEETARENLRHSLWRLRNALASPHASIRSRASPVEDYLLTDDLTIAFNASADFWLDVAELKKLSEKASADELLAKLSVYQGEFLPGFYNEWVELEREHLYAIFEHHMARLMALLEKEQRWLDIIEWGERWIKLGQGPEPAYRALMSAHAAKGDMSKVAATYERCIKSLREVGVEPSESTRMLYMRLKARQEPIEPGPTIPAESMRPGLPKTNLPVPLTSFIGREQQVDQVVSTVKKKRLVTLTGSGGVGKTRLAIRCAQRLLSEFAEGVWWVDLVGLNDDSLVLQAVSKIANVREVPYQPLFESLVDDLRTKHILLILDNCEHLIEGCAQLANKLLSVCPNLKILATSREGLGVTGEDILQVPTLSLPGSEQIRSIDVLASYESVRLFIERAAAINSDFSLTERNAAYIAQVCQRLGGIPLAIELAAARVKVLTVEQIAARLDDRFNLLTSGSRTAFARHQTLRAALDWSYDLLPEDEQILFRRLSIFAGSWSLEQAQAICAGEGIEADAVLDLLSHLVDKSLAVMQEQKGESRYQMLETIREYGLKKFPESSEATQLRNRHLEYFTKFLEGTEPKLHGIEQAVWLKRLETEHDNLRAALDWAATEGDLESGLKLAGALWLFWDINGFHLEGRAWSDRLLRKCHGSTTAPSAPAQARLHYVAGHLRQRQGDFERARRQYQQSLSIYRQLKDEMQVAVVLRGLGEVSEDEGDLASAQNYYEQSLSIVRTMNDSKGASVVLGHLAIVALLQNNYERAAALCKEALALGRERKDNRAIAIALSTLGFASWGLKELDQATKQFTEALVLQAGTTDKRVAQYVLIGMALVALAKNHPAKAARLFGAADTLREVIGTPLPPSQRPWHDSFLSSVRAQLGEATFHAVWAEGRAMTLQEAIEYALLIE